MSDMQPTPSGGASVTERLEAMLSAGDEKQPEVSSGQEAAPETEAPEVAEAASDEPEQEEGPQIELSDVARFLGVDASALDVDEDGTVKVKTKIDGKEGAAKFNELLKNYQLQGHVDAKVRQIAERDKASVERASQIEQFATAKFQELTALSQAAQQLLMDEAAQTNWDELVRSDPITYTEKRHQYEQKAHRVGQFLNQINQQQQQLSQAWQWKQAQDLQSEAQRLSTLVPEWADEKTRESERVEIAKWLYSKGASERAVNSLMDAGMVAALRAGYLAEKSAPQVAAIEKKVRAAPKLVKPGQSVDANQRNAESMRGLKEQIRKSGGKGESVTEYLIRAGKV